MTDFDHPCWTCNVIWLAIGILAVVAGTLLFHAIREGARHD